jgi:hypothetical protein
MKADDLDFNAMKAINLDDKALEPGSRATPCSTFIWAIASGDIPTAESQLADDITWGLMPYNKVLKGKSEVIPWLKAGHSDQKRPIAISNVLMGNCGVFEYWNIGTVSEALVKFGNEQGWPWPRDPSAFVGRKYRVAQCFVYHVDGEGKMTFMRQYLDAGSVWAQFV